MGWFSPSRLVSQGTDFCPCCVFPLSGKNAPCPADCHAAGGRQSCDVSASLPLIV